MGEKREERGGRDKREGKTIEMKRGGKKQTRFLDDSGNVAHGDVVFLEILVTHESMQEKVKPYIKSEGGSARKRRRNKESGRGEKGSKKERRVPVTVVAFPSQVIEAKQRLV